MDLLTELNEPQRTACALTEGPVLILAGAGSGKTRTLTYRVAHLIHNLGVDAGSILAFTFTNKAAREMIDRIEQLVGSDSKRMWVGTFHAICVRILRQDIERLGYDPRFLIYDSDDQKALMRSIVRDWLHFLNCAHSSRAAFCAAGVSPAMVVASPKVSNKDR